MPIINQEFTKRYYTIGEVAEIFDVSKSLIRFWEQEFETLRPHKNSKGERRFTPSNLEQFKQIYFLVKEKGYTLQGANQELIQKKAFHAKKSKTIKRLKELKGFLESLKQKV